MDGKILTGTLATFASASSTWLDTVTPIVTITVTVIVGAATLWYTVERALKVRQERLAENDK